MESLKAGKSGALGSLKQGQSGLGVEAKQHTHNETGLGWSATLSVHAVASDS